MRVDSLIQLLKKVSPDAQVMICIDADAERFQDIDHNFGYYLMNADGEMVEELDLRDNDTEKNYDRVVILWPVG